MSDDKSRGTFIDLAEARRKRSREADLHRYPGLPARDEPPDQGDEPVRLGWQDVLAMIIATYQILLPVVGIIIVVLVAVYLLFTLVFH